MGPKWHSPIGSMPFHRTQKTIDFQGPTPSHLPSYGCCRHKKHYARGRRNLRCINSYKVTCGSYGPWKLTYIITIYALCTYDIYGPVRNVFDACRSITRASGRRLGPGNRDFLDPEMATREAKPPPICPSTGNGFSRIKNTKTLRTGPYKS